MHKLRLPRFCCTKYTLRPSRTSGSVRDGSPPGAISTLTISAPSSAISRVTVGPARYCVKSRTLMPVKMRESADVLMSFSINRSGFFDEVQEIALGQHLEAERRRFLELRAGLPSGDDVVDVLRDPGGDRAAEALDPGLRLVPAHRAERAGEHEALARKLAVTALLPRRLHAGLEQATHLLAVTRLAEELEDGSRHLGPDVADFAQLFFACRHDPLDVAEVVGQCLGGRFADVADRQAVQEPVERGLLARRDA